MKVLRQVGVERFSSYHTGFQLMLRGQHKRFDDDAVADHLLSLSFHDSLNNEHMIFEDVTSEVDDTPDDKAPVVKKPMTGKTQRRRKEVSE